MSIRVAIQNPFYGQFVAEVELSRRIYLAATHLGWDAAEVHTSTEINAFNPDFVIALHNNSPKLAGYPTYGCMWNPPSFFEGTERFVKHALTYDGYLVASKVLDRWMHQILSNTNKQIFTAPFYPSCPQNQYHAPSLENPHLVYLGSNWDGARFPDLFERLDAQEYMQVYGNPDGWKHLKHAYQGALPYDGQSVFKALNQAGVGLCLHREEHRRSHLPTMRIFEIVASGAIAICDDNPFIRDAFGDAVFYIDSTLSSSEQVEKISNYINWIKHNQDVALAMSAKAHQIFLQNYALETLLLNILPHHEALIREKGFITSTEKASDPGLSTPSDRELFNRPNVQFILPLTDRNPSAIKRSLDNLIQQTYPNLSLVIVTSKLENDSVDLLKSYADKVSLKWVEILQPQWNSTYLWAGLNAIDGEYFAILDPNHLIHPNHVYSLVSILEKNSDVEVAYSGALKSASFDQPLSALTADNPAELIEFQPFNLDRFLLFEPFITSSSFVARRSLLSPILNCDPQLNECGDLCLLLYLAQQTAFRFSYEITCESYQPTADISRSLFEQSQDWSSEISRLKFIFWHQEFAPGKSIQSIHRSYLESYLEIERLRSKTKHLQTEIKRSQDELQNAKSVIEAMETSKFWKLRNGWFKLKRAIGLPTENE